MNAAKARKAVEDWMVKVTKENRSYNRERIKEEDRIAAALWKEKGALFLRKIDGYIKKASSNGRRYINEPSRINPNGDTVIWLEESDRPIYKILMAHYRQQGFTVEEYEPLGFRIEW
jgi:hypothetical protein